MLLNPQFPADLVIFAKEILNEKLHFLCNVEAQSHGEEIVEVYSEPC